MGESFFQRDRWSAANKPLGERSSPPESAPTVELKFIRLIEEVALNALPALQSIVDDGWIVRFAQGYTRRANSVNPIYPSSLPLDEKIERCEALYQQQGLKPTFKLTALNDEENLEARLERRGYHREMGTSVQLLDLKLLDQPRPETVLLSPAANETWFADYCRMNALPEAKGQVMRQLLTTIVPAACFASLRQDDQTAAVGLGVVERGYLGLFDIVTDPAFRQRGLGTKLVSGLLHWGKANGALYAYLQVVPDNTPALGLYAKLGFKEAYPYWYRVKAAQP